MNHDIEHQSCLHTIEFEGKTFWVDEEKWRRMDMFLGNKPVSVKVVITCHRNTEREASCAYLHMLDIPYEVKFLGKNKPSEIRCQVPDYALFHSKLYEHVNTYKRIIETGIKDFKIEIDGNTSNQS